MTGTEAVVIGAALLEGLTAGALVTEAVVLVPFWRALPPESFLAWYRRHGALLVRLFGPLEVGSAVLASVAALVARPADARVAGLLAVAALLTIVVLAMFVAYFRRANASFFEGTIATAAVDAELRRWSLWHWARVGIGGAAFALTLVAAVSMRGR